MKKFIAILAALAALFLVAGCGTFSEEPDSKPALVQAYPPQILEHKGTAFGKDYPKWMDAALDGAKAVEKLPDFAGKYIVVVTQDGGDLTGTQLAASRLDAIPVIAGLISTRVKDSFAGAQVGDKDKIETYMERCVKIAAESTFTGFALQSDWWAKLQIFTPAGKPDKQLYRVIQIWGIDKTILQQQIAQILKDNAAAEAAPTPEKQRAMDLVQKGFFDGF